MLLSVNGAVSGRARSGSIRVSFFATSKVCLSMYANILWVKAGSVMQAMTFTLRFSHTSHWVISILNALFNLWAHDIARARYDLSESFSAKRGLNLPRCEAVTSARTAALAANFLYGQKASDKFTAPNVWLWFHEKHKYRLVLNAKKQRRYSYLPKLASGEWVSCFGLT